jgi:hypothetical protein
MRRHTKDVDRTLFNFGGIIRRPAGRRLWLLLIVLMTGCSVAIAVRAYNRRTPVSVASGRPANASVVPATNQTTVSTGGLLSRLRLQPEADKLRRRLGQRFTNSSLGVSVLLGTLTIGNSSRPIRITRAQDGEGDQVAVTIGGEPATLSWNSTEGAKASANSPTASQRAIVERLALDSPDQFIFAQLRGAAYNLVGRDVRPAEAAGSDEYEGPVWDMVRVVESTSRSSNKPQSPWRIYYLNSSTGLIDKILSQEEDDNVIAQFSPWVNQGGEVLPAGITWTQNKQVLMQLTISNISLSSR